MKVADVWSILIHETHIPWQGQSITQTFWNANTVNIVPQKDVVISSEPLGLYACTRCLVTFKDNNWSAWQSQFIDTTLNRQQIKDDNVIIISQRHAKQTWWIDSQQLKDVLYSSSRA